MRVIPSLLAVLLTPLAVAAGNGQRYYVDIDSPVANGSGLSWNSPFKYLQDGLEEAQTWLQQNDGPVEIWVARGTYRPDRDRFNPDGNDSRSRSFELMDEVFLYGGFAGTETALDQRQLFNPALRSILTGEIGAPGFADNCYHVVDGSYAGGNGRRARLDGFTIERGSANRNSTTSRRAFGGGFYADFGQADIVNCTFRDNRAYRGGGAVATFDGHLTVFANCTFQGNSSARGGAIFQRGSTQEVIQCVFDGNVSSFFGGGIGLEPGNTNAYHVLCTYTGNDAPFGGAAWIDDGAHLQVYNGLEWGNPGNIGQFAYVEGRLTVEGLTREDSFTNILDLSGATVSLAQVTAANPQFDAGSLRPSMNSRCGRWGSATYHEQDYGDIDQDGVVFEPVPLDLDLRPRVAGASIGCGAYEPSCEAESYCSSPANSVSFEGAHIGVHGSCRAADQDLVLVALDVPDQPGLFFFGPGAASTPLGNGTLCVGGTLYRLPVEFATGGTLRHTLDWSSQAVSQTIFPGTSWRFQAWFRDPAGHPSGFSLSDGVRVSFD